MPGGVQWCFSAPDFKSRGNQFITNTDVNYALLPCFSLGATREQRNSQIFSFIRHLSGSSTLAPSCTISPMVTTIPDLCQTTVNLSWIWALLAVLAVVLLVVAAIKLGPAFPHAEAGDERLVNVLS